MTRRILALNPWHGGSHRAFLDGWMKHSRHEFTVMPLPAYKWKWRMRHSAVTYSQLLEDRLSGHDEQENCWDVLFCTDMLSLAEFRGLCPRSVHRLPSVVYFHENQLTYPNRNEDVRDLHFAYSNMTTALAANAVWFNSAYHRDEFLTALRGLLKRMPDFGHEELVDLILEKSSIQYPGIESESAHRAADVSEERMPGPLRIAWASRWEHDKNPDLFFAALDELKRSGTRFEINVLGESFRDSPECFGRAQERFKEQIRHWGFAKDRNEYLRVLSESDVVVSTARHEFFGISVLEAVSQGCYPLVPDALAYPETLGTDSGIFHDGTAAGIAAVLIRLADSLAGPVLVSSQIQRRPNVNVECFLWQTRADELDDAVEQLC